MFLSSVFFENVLLIATYVMKQQNTYIQNSNAANPSLQSPKTGIAFLERPCT